MTRIAVGRMGAGARSSNVQTPKLGPIGAAALCAIAVVGFTQVWQLRAMDAALRSAIETGITLSASVSAVLLFAHFRRTRRVRDLLLLVAAATVALTDFVFHALPAYHDKIGIGGAAAHIALTTLIAGTFLAVAFAPGEREVQAGTVRRRDGDREAVLLVMAAVCMAGAQLGRLTVSASSAEWVTPSDALRVGAYALLLAVSVRMYRRSQEEMTRNALSAERLRVAQDLHEGLAQDMALIAALSKRLAREFDADHPLAIAAQRALNASRGEIVDLSATTASNTEQALREVAAEFESRFGVAVTVNVDAGLSAGAPEPSRRERHELVRIAREAIANAVRHGGARNVTVRLASRRDNLLLRISDDGCGFGGASGKTAGTGLGIRTMRARAKSLGGQLVTRTRDSGGGEIEILTARQPDAAVPA